MDIPPVGVLTQGRGTTYQRAAAGWDDAHEHHVALGKRLRRRVALAENNAELQVFIRRAFQSGDVGGHA